MRMCVDYCGLNTVTIENKYPLLHIDELFDQPLGAGNFTKTDLWSGYLQVCIKIDDVPKTAFKTHFGLFELLVMPFGLINAPTTFMTLIDNVLKPFLGKFVVIFLD